MAIDGEDEDGESVIERIPDIGLQRAIGAKRADIRREFLVEGMLVAGAGAAGGAALGGLAAVATCAYIGLVAHWSERGVLAAVLAGLVLGVIAAAGPAAYASHLNPADALRVDQR